MFVAMSAWLMMPTSRWPSITGRRRTLLSVIVRSASLIESSAPMVTVLPSPTPSSPALTLLGSFPWASTFTTMSRSVSMPLRRSSSPQIGTAPTSRSARSFAASRTLSFSPMHVGSDVMTSLAFLSATADPPSVGSDLSPAGSLPAMPRLRARKVSATCPAAGDRTGCGGIAAH
jgi:hypothetical protein